MGFRITRDDTGAGPIVLRVEGNLVGDDVAHVLREQIVEAASAERPVVVDLRDVAWYGDACLAILQERPRGVALTGGGALLATLLEQRRAARGSP
jgi:anti-anti-sigma regulatory factor